MCQKTLEIPPSLLIEGEVWRVKLDNDPSLKEIFKRPYPLLLSENALGACHYEERVIVLSCELSEDHKEEAFLHEVLHATLARFKHKGLTKKLEEALVEELDGPLMRVLRRLTWK